ncbi:MAG: insulinase family protein [Bacteroidales bacterium]|nr:insulinase family protein [Bacteroidales bacterium]
MLQYTTHTLPNGLQVLLHRDNSTPLVSLSLLYDVGARDEDPNLTGMAHLLEHLMFSGTEAYPDYDREAVSMGGENNAFTNNDCTNYYITLPAEHLEHAVEVEADRMRNLSISMHSLQTQQQVVTEEYRQRYENQPYGDVWMLLRPLCYKVHPYRWCTIGADINHIKQASREDVRRFYDTYYHPSNAILALAGNIDPEQALGIVERHFGPMAAGCRPQRQLPVEGDFESRRELEVVRDVPANAIYVARLMCDRLGKDFHAYDMISDLLGNGKSARLYNNLVKRQGLFSEIDACVSGEADRGLFVVSGKLVDGVTFEQAEAAIDDELSLLAQQKVDDNELEKVKNKYESTFVLSQYKAIDRAMALCAYADIGNAALVNDEPSLYRAVTADDVSRVARSLADSHPAVLRIKKSSTH